jgi:succinoglycan biosynthesis transport protein ExoP
VVGWTLHGVAQLFRAFAPARRDRPETPRDRELRVADLMKREMTVKRVGLTYVIEVDYHGYRADEVSTIANAIADAYVVGELEARYGAAQRAGDWLRDQIREVGEQASAADMAVQRYKTEHNIVDTSRGLVMEQRLGDINSQLANAGAATAEAKARLDRVVEIAESPFGDAAVADSLHSDVISRLRAQFLDLDSKEADYASRFGKDHASVQNIHGQKIQIQAAARQELRRVAESTRSDYAIAAAREQSLKSNLDDLIATSAKDNEARGVLRNLQGVAQTYRDLYETMLQKDEETTRQQSFPVTGDRVITAADPPLQPSWPKPAIVIGAGAFAGLVFGFSLALSKEALGNTFRVGEDIVRHTGLECLGIVPAVRFSPGASRASAAPAIARHCIAEPLSRFSETIRNVKVSIDLCRPDGRAAVIGIVSSVPLEGKTTFGCNFALLCAQIGPRVILLDGDLHRRGLTRMITPAAEQGLIELLEGRATVEQVVRRDPVTGLDFIPCVTRADEPNAAARLASAAMAALVADLRGRYDYVVVDLPPIIPVVDVKASAGLIDFFVFVVEWGRTRRDIVRDALNGAEEVRERAIGAVLNKADPDTLRRLEAYGASPHGGAYAAVGSSDRPEMRAAGAPRSGVLGVCLDAIGVLRANGRRPAA